MRQLLAPITLFAAAVTLFFSCQKEISPRTTTTAALSSKNPADLSLQIRVWHGTRTKAALPTPRGTAIQLNPSAQPTVNSFGGHFAILKPEVTSGNVKGYYIGVSGAPDYFTVDFSKPRNINGRVGGSKKGGTSTSTAFGRLSRIDSTGTGGGNADSALVIVLPPNIKVPDTVCMTYWAFDSLGNISQPVTTCIIINSLGTDAANNWILGNWRETATWGSFSGTTFHDSIIYNKWVQGQDGLRYECFFDSLSNTSKLQHLSSPNGVPVVSDSFYYKKAQFGLSNTGAFQFESDNDYKQLNFSASQCNQFVFLPVVSNVDKVTGGWHYDRATGKFLMVMEMDDNGNPVLEAWEYKAIKVNDRHFLIMDDSSLGDIFYIRFEK